MADHQYLVVRTDDDSKAWVAQEIGSGRICQGWGVTGLSLKDETGVLAPDTWTSRFKDIALRTWGEQVDDDLAARRYRILLPMTTAVAGDRIVVPKMPDWRTFALAEVDKGYFFDDAPAAQRGGQEDLRHTICIRNIKYFSYHSSEHARLIHKKMRAYQAAVNRVWDKNFQEAVETLLGRPSQTIDLGITAIFEDVKQQHARSVLGSLRKLKWDDVEQLVENLFKESGYDVVVRHRYDKEGGDADLVLTTKVPLLNEFTDMDLIVYVQVKNKDGKDYDDVHHVEQLIKISRDAVNCLKVLISTTDEFTAEARRLAQESNVILLDGMGLVRLLNKYL